MRNVCRFVNLTVLLCLVIIKMVSAEKEGTDGGNFLKTKSVIQVVDSLMIDLGKMDSTICIDNKVVLSFDNDTIFACEWIDLATGDTISKEKTVTVSPDSTREYQVNLYYFTGELIKNGDFEDESLPEYQRVTTGYAFGWTANSYGYLGPEGKYRIGKSPRDFHKNFYRLADHTSGHGNMMVVNGSTSGNALVWQQKVKVEIGRTYAFSTWGVEVGRNNPAQFHFTINGKTLGKDFQLEDYGEQDARWEQFYELWVADQTEAVISLVNLNTKSDGNDFAIDDISFASMKKLTGKITVKVLPEVKLGKLENIEKCEGEKIRIDALATGTGITGYQWKKEGVLLSGREALLEYESARLDLTGNYTCSVSGECGTREEKFRIDVREKLRFDRLRDTVWPCEESAYKLTADVHGYEPHYKWTKPAKSEGWYDGKSADYINDRIYWNRDTGVYTCQVTNICGEVTVYRVLKERQKLRVTDWVGDQNVCAGSDVTLFVDTYKEPLRVTWKGPGVNGMEGNQLVVKNVNAGNVGVYVCTVEDECGKSVSLSSIVTMVPPMNNLEVCRDTAVCENGRAVLWAKADGVKTRYQWSGPDNFSASTAEIVIDPVTAGRVGEYKVVAIDSCGNEKSEIVRLSFYKEYEDLRISENMEVCPGEMITLEVSGGGKGMAYDWILPDGNHAIGAIQHLIATPGQYSCSVSGVCRPVVKSMSVVLKQVLKAESGINHFVVCPGERVDFVPVITGTNVRCEWWKGPIKLDEGMTYSLGDVQAGDAGSYECRVRSDCGEAVLNYEIRVKEPLQILDYSPTKNVKKGEKTALFVNVAGDHDRTYQWFVDGKPIAGADLPRIELQVPDRDTLIVYTFKVSGCNTEQVNIAVRVRDFETVVKDTVVRLCEGSDYSYRVPEKPEDWCREGTIRMLWIYNSIDTVSYSNAITISGFENRLAGEYVYTMESDCGKETVRLQVDSVRVPKIIAIHSDRGQEKDGVIIACTGDDVQLIPEIKTYGAVVYEWSKDGAVIPGATEAVLRLSNMTAEQEGRYSCRVIGLECGESVRAIDLKVYKELNITYVPELEKCPGEAAMLQVLADASVPSVFTWSGPDRKGWITETDGYSSRYQNAAIHPESDGIYQCRVTNVCGEKIANIHLSVEKELILPELTRNDTLCPGENVELSIPLDQGGAAYSWTLPDHREVEQKVLGIERFSVSDTGIYVYTVKTRNNCFTVSGEVRLYMRPEMQLSMVSPDTAVCEGQKVRLFAFAEGKEVEYEWWGPKDLQFRGQQLEINPVTGENSGVYEVVVTDICDKTGKRKKVKLSLRKEFDDLVVSRDTGVCQGSDVTLRAVSHTPGLTYAWSWKGNPLGNDAELLLNQVEESEKGQYVCRISGTCQTVERTIELEIFPHLKAQKLEAHPVCVRENTELVVNAIGREVRYRWTKEGDEKGYRENRLDLIDVIPSDSGIYQCEVTSLCGDTTLVYDFQLKESTKVFLHTVDRILCVNDDYKLRVAASGEPNRYSWSCNGQAQAETDSVIYRIAPEYADTLVYTCRVEGECGADSVDITIKVGDYRKLRTDRKDTLCEGSNYKYNVDVVPLGAFEGQGFNYCWTFKGKVIRDTLSSIFALTEVDSTMAGDYHCRISTLDNAPEPKSAEIILHIDVVRQPALKFITPDIYAVEGSCDTIRVEASGDLLTYSWTKDSQTFGGDTAVLYFVPLEEKDRGDYVVAVKNQCGHVTAKTAVEVWRKTVIVFPQERDDSVCLRSTKDLEVIAWGENGLLYKWFLNGELLDVPFKEPLHIEEAKKEDQGLYLCVVTGRGGMDSCKIHLDVLDLPSPSISGKFRLCPNETEMAQHYIAGSDRARVSYDWSVEGGNVWEGINWGEAAVIWDAEQKGKITLTVTSLVNGCRDSLTEEIEYLPAPDVNLVVPSYVGYCQDTLKLNTAYPWGGIFTVNGIADDVVRFTDKNRSYAIDYYYTDAVTGCSANKTDTIRLAEEPVLQLAHDTVQSGWCAPVRLEIARYSPGDITWGGKQMPDIIDKTHAVYQASGYSEEVLKFWAVLTDTYRCQASDSVRVILLPSPLVRMMPDTVIGVCNELIVQGDCELEEPQQVKWMPESEVSVTGTYTAKMLDKSEGIHPFVMVVTDSYGCTGSDTVRVTVAGAPELESEEICVGHSIAVDLGDFAAYQWDDGYQGNVRILSDPGYYGLEVEDRYGCMGEANYQVHALPVVRLNDTLIYDGQKMDFVVDENTEYPPYRIVWQDGSSKDFYTAEKEGSYFVEVQDNIGCSARDTAYLTVKKWYIAAPDAFLPGSSGENSRFYLKEVNFGSHFEMYIYDRWGELLFKTDEIGFKGGWDGTFKGMHCQPGAYVWVAFVDGKEVGRGTLMLVK